MPCCVTIHTERAVCRDKVNGVAFTTVITVAFICAVFENMTKFLVLETGNYSFFNIFY